MDKLNPRQRQAVHYIDSPLLVLAGAGSGKTRVITRKIAWLIEQCNLQPRQILAVTFTNKAAREMKERVAQLLKKAPGSKSGGKTGKSGAADTPRISTFHTLGLGILSREIKLTGRRPGFSIYDAQDSLGLIRDILQRIDIPEEDLKHIQWKISEIKNDPRVRLNGHRDEAIPPHVWAVYDQYQELLKTYNAFDFDDLIAETVSLLHNHQEVREKWQNLIRYILVDEYQDTNGMQYRLIRQLTGVRGALTVVGDDDQSIYAWRGARPENMQLLQQDYPSLKVIKLEQNYRSSGNILRAANELIGNNPHLFEKTLWCDMGPGDPISVVCANDDDDEIQRVVGDILHHHYQHRTRFQDYAVLFRSNHQSRKLEQMLREHNIPYSLSGGTSFFTLSEVKDIMAYLRLLVNPDDDASFIRVVNTPKRELGPATIEKLAGYAGQRHVSLFAACFELGLEQQLSSRPLSRLRQFVDWLTDLGDRAERGDPIAAVRDLIRDCDYETWLRDTSKDLKTAEKRMANVHELVNWMEVLVKQDRVDDEIGKLVGHMSLMDILDSQQEENQGDRVRLMTLHSAKGLEFPYLYIIGMEEGLLPHRNSINSDDVEEERRIAYVGITRARRRLTLSYCRRRYRQGEWAKVEPSRFLDELPDDTLNWEGRPGSQISEQERKTQGQARLASLRNMLEV